MGGTQSTDVLNVRTSDLVARKEAQMCLFLFIIIIIIIIIGYLLEKRDGSHLLMLRWGSEGVETPRRRMTPTPVMLREAQLERQFPRGQARTNQ